MIAVIGSPQLQALGYWYVLVPVLAGASLLLLVALVVNKLAPTRHYPLSRNWYRFWQRSY